MNTCKYCGGKLKTDEEIESGEHADMRDCIVQVGRDNERQGRERAKLHDELEKIDERISLFNTLGKLLRG